MKRNMAYIVIALSLLLAVSVYSMPPSSPPATVGLGTGDVTGPVTPTAGSVPKWGPSGKALVDGFILGTLTDAKWCSYATATGITCTENAPASGDGNDTEINRLATAIKALSTAPMNGTVGATTPATGIFTAVTDSGLTITRVPFASTGGLLADDGNFTFNSTTDTLTVNRVAAAITGNASTATALAANGANCSAGQAPLGVDASGAVETCWTPTTMANDTIWDVAGDIVQATGSNASAKLAIGTAGQVPHVNAGATALEYSVGFTIDPDGDVTAKSYTTTRTTDPQTMILYEGSGGGSNKTTITTEAALAADATITFGEQSLDFAAGTYTDGKYCTYTASGTVIACNSTPQSLLTNSAGLLAALNDETGTGVAVFGTGPTIDAPIVTSAEVDCHADGNLTVAQVSGTVVTNYDQADGNVTCILPTAARGMNALFTVATARAKTYGVQAKFEDKIYLLAAAGTIAAGADHGKAVMVNAQVGQQFICYTFKTGATAYDWACKAIAIGTSTFEAR